VSALELAVAVRRLDLAQLAARLDEVAAAGCRELHIDIGDGRFTADYGLGFEVLEAVRTNSDLPCHIHLQTLEPDRAIDRFGDAGCKTLSVHAETCLHAPRTLAHIRELGMTPGIALNAATPLTRLEYLLPYTDCVLLVLQEPGTKQAEIPSAALERVRILRENLDYLESRARLQVKGAIAPADATRLIECGADTIVIDAPALRNGSLDATLEPYSRLLG